MSEPSPTPRDSAPAAASPKEPGSPSPLAEFPAQPQTGFSLRFLIGASICFALVFAVAGIMGRDWNQRQLVVFVSLFLGGNTLSALMLYVVLYRRRRLKRTFGRLLYKSQWPSMFAVLNNPPSLYALSAVCFSVLAGVCLLTAHASRDALKLPSVFALYGVLPLYQVSFVRLATSRAGGLEVYEFGLRTVWQGRISLKDIVEARWAGTQPNSLVLVINKKGNGNHTLTLKVPKADCDRVGAILHAALGDRFNDARIPPQAEA